MNYVLVQRFSQSQKDADSLSNAPASELEPLSVRHCPALPLHSRISTTLQAVPPAKPIPSGEPDAEVSGLTGECQYPESIRPHRQTEVDFSDGDTDDGAASQVWV